MLKTALLALLAFSGYATAATYSNPIRQNGADPFIVWDKPTGKYWFLTTTYQNLQISSADTIEGLKTASKDLVYTSADTQRLGNTWAPEIHNVGGKWYPYYSLDYKPQVLTGGTNPAGPYTGQVTLSNDFGIDGTVLKIASVPYFVWSCLRPVAGYTNPQQSICISKLTTPTSIDSTKIGVISRPDQKWEQIGTSAVPAVNEAPQPMYWAGNTYLTYSASYCGTANYSIGLLRYTSGDPVNPASWVKKTDAPVFSSNNGQYSTAHNGIFTSPNGAELWNVFHAVTNPQGSCGTDRATWTLKLDTSNFNAATGPKFGNIPPAGTRLAGPAGERV